MNNCSRCGASNPETNKFCGSCGQLLAAAAPPPSASPADELPPWLQTPDQPPSAVNSSTNASDADSSELPAWLSDIGVEDSRAQSPSAPDWLAQLQQPASSSPASSSDTELPAWLREDTPTQQPEPSGVNDAPVWPNVRGAAEETSGNVSDELPDWLRADDLPAVPAASVPTSTSGHLPDWLQSNDLDADSLTAPSTNAPDELPGWMRPNAGSAAPSAAASNDLPDWLQSDDVAPAPQATTSMPAAVPDWLREAEPAQLAQPTSASSDLPDWLSEADTNGTQAVAPLAQSDSVDELPAWLRDTEPAPAITASSSNGLANPADVDAEDQLPAWLQTSPTPTGTTQQDDGGLPAWLADTAETEQPTNLGASASSATGSLPDWLLDDSTSATAGAENHQAQIYNTTAQSNVPAWLADTPSNEASASEVEVPVPNWANEFGEAPPAPDQIGLQDTEELPSWLDNASSAPTSSPQVHSEVDGLPAWLAEESPTSAPTSAATQSFTAASSQTPSNADLPAWLSDDTPAANTSSTADTEELPAWLPKDIIEPVDNSSAPSGAETEELPPWLRDDASISPAVGAASSADTNQLPSWLTDTAPTGVPVAQQAHDTDDPGMTQELPPWLLDQPLSSDAAPVSNVDAGANNELPAWLQADDETTSTPATTGQASNAGAGANDQLPPWLQTVDETPPADSQQLPPWLGLPDQPADDQHTAQVYNSAPADDLPAWLSNDDAASGQSTAQMYDTPAATTGSATPSTSEDEGVNLPTWLNEADTVPASTETSSDLPPWLSGMPEQPTAQSQSTTSLPSWLDEPEQTSSVPNKSEAGQSELLGNLDLPAWLRDETASKPAAPALEVAPNWLQRVTPEAEDAATQVTVEDVPPRPRVVRTPERLAAANMLQQLMTEPVVEPMLQPAKRRRSRVLTIVLALIALLIIGALLTVLLSDRFGLNFGSAPVSSPMVASTAQIINGLPAGRPVVLAYEWDAQRLGELRPLEEVVVGQLATRTDVPLIFLSTDPQGALLATERTVQVASLKDNFHDQYGLGYVNLGFKAGGPFALRRFADNAAFGSLFAQDASGIDLRANDVTMTSMCGGPTAERCSWNNVSLLVVMADDANDVRGWFEQVRSEHPELQTLLLTPAEIGPEVQPYAVTSNVAMLVGLRDAEAYAQVIGSPSERVGRQLDATAVGSALFAAAVVIGGIPAVITGRRARRFDADDQLR